MVDMFVTKRVGIPHIVGLTPSKFINLHDHIINDCDGDISSFSYSLKVDGLGARFGRTDSGECFFESSRSGPITSDGVFLKYTLKTTGDSSRLRRAKLYDDLSSYIRSSTFTQNLPKGCKIVAEILYNPLATHRLYDNTLTFVKVPYPVNKLGSILTISIIDVLDSCGSTHSRKFEIMDDLVKQSTDHCLIIDPTLPVVGSMDVTELLTPIGIVGDWSKVNSRKSVDTQLKAELKRIMMDVKVDLTKFILNSSSLDCIDILGPNLEGVVVNTNKIGMVKVVHV